jgi:hypothetical protein
VDHRGSFRGRARPDEDSDRSDPASQCAPESVREAYGNNHGHRLGDTGGISVSSSELHARRHCERKSECCIDRSDECDAANTSATHPECDAGCYCGSPDSCGYADDGRHGNSGRLCYGSSASFADEHTETESIDCPRRNDNSRGCDFTGGPDTTFANGSVTRHTHADREAFAASRRDASNSTKNSAAYQHSRAHGTARERD